MLDVFTKEIKSFFENFVGFVFMGLFLLITGIIFTVNNLSSPGSSDYRRTLASITFIFMFAVPLLTMRLLAEERRQKTDQLLLTSPLSLTGIIVGKYLAALAVFLMTLFITLLYPVLLDQVGLIVPSEIGGSYIGFFLLGASFISVGLLVSSMTDNQVIAAVVTFSALLLVWILDWLQRVLPSDRGSGIVFSLLLAVGAALFVYFTVRAIAVSVAMIALEGGAILLLYILTPTFFDGLLVRFLKWFSLLERYQEFNRGVLSFEPIIYYLSFTGIFIFLTVRIVESRRWK